MKNNTIIQTIGGDLYTLILIKTIWKIQILKETFKIEDKISIKYKIKFK